MSVFIDRRPNSNKKNNINKKKFIDRNSEDIDKSIKNIISNKSLEELSNENENFDISISQDGIKEPKIKKDSKTGNNEQVYPFNDQYSKGDRIPKPKGQNGQGLGEGEASNEGEGEDSFEFKLSQEDFVDYLFKNMELPNLNKTNIKNSSYKKKQRAGFTSSGNPSSLCVKTSYIKSLQRKIAIESSFDKKITKMKENNEDIEDIKHIENKK
jgi:uncharacterized sporulation protein YeaH/YhbH (DUF444 family)